MKRICVLGWYGTETIGDRAILDGLLILFDRLFGEYDLKLASLYPFFSERTLIEDEQRFEKSAPKCQLSIVDEYEKKSLFTAIKQSDYVVMGGGPIMNLEQLTIIADAFAFAQRHLIKTIILGAGLGPLNGNYYIKEAKRLLKHSDYIFFRDRSSCELAKKMYGEEFNCTFAGDPAIISIIDYFHSHCAEMVEKLPYIACNLRDFPRMEYGDTDIDVNKVLCKFLHRISELQQSIILVPMHTFDIGGDDRKYLYSITKQCKMENVFMKDMPLSLEETYRVYSSANLCVGMRYHSVVMQTILNGNNIVIDYTNPQNGKINGFLQSYGIGKCYENKYTNLFMGNKAKNEIDVNLFLPYEDAIQPLRKDFIAKCDDVLDEYINLFGTRIGEVKDNGKKD